MPPSEDFRRNFRALLEDMEGRARRARDAHFLAARRWESVNTALGVSAVLVGVVGGAAAGTGAIAGANSTTLGAVFSAIAGMLAGFTAFLRPSDRIERHKRAGDSWSALRDRAAKLHALDLHQADLNQTELSALYERLLEDKKKVTDASPIIPSWAYERVMAAGLKTPPAPRST